MVPGQVSHVLASAALAVGETQQRSNFVQRKAKFPATLDEPQPAHLRVRVRDLRVVGGRIQRARQRRVGRPAARVGAQVLRRGRNETKLSFYEVQLLKYLHERAGQPVSRDEILDKVWGIEASPNNRTVDNFVVKLRKKLEPTPDEPRHILTVYGVGYKLVV